MGSESSAGLHEERTRVMLYLPVTGQNEMKAANLVLTFVKSLKDIDLVDVKGFTLSSVRPPAFSGWWYSSDQDQWICDNIQVCIVDYKLGFGTLDIEDRLDELRATMSKAYEQFGAPQEEFWIIAYQVFRSA